MCRDLDEVLVATVAGDLLEPLGRSFVEHGSLAQQDRLVDHVAEQCVLEDVLAGAAEGRWMPGEDELALMQRCEVVVAIGERVDG